MSAEKSTLSRSCQRKIEMFWRKSDNSPLLYVSALTSSEMTVDKYAMVGCLVKFLSKQKLHNLVTKIKSTFLESYVRHVIGGRSVLKSHVVKSCRELLRHVTRDEFQSLILPALDRALLRNPETAIVCECISSSGCSSSCSTVQQQQQQQLLFVIIT